MNSLLGQIRKSRLVEWLIAYVTFAWLAAQFVSIIADVWDLSDVFQRRAHIVLAFGAPVTAILAWFHGEKGEQRFSRGEILVLAALFGAAAIAIPSVGVAGPTVLFGIPSSIILPCSLVMMIVIPAWLIFLSVYKDRQHDDSGDAKPINEPSEETLNELWQMIVKAFDQRQIGEARDQIARLLAQHPESQELRAFKIAARRVAQDMPKPRDDSPGIASLGASAKDIRATDIEIPVADAGSAKTGKSDRGRSDRIDGIFGATDAAAASESRPSSRRTQTFLRRVRNELKRRNVTRAVVIYAVVIFIAYSSTSVVFEQLSVPAVGVSTAPPPAMSIAVLPFVNISADPNDEYFSDSISEEVVNLLAKAPELRVASRSDAFSFKGESVDIATMASKLNVVYVLEGGVRKTGDELRINVRLMDAAANMHLWSETYDSEIDNVSAIQDEIAAAVVDALEATKIEADHAPDYVDMGSLALVFIVFGFSVLVVLFWSHGRKRQNISSDL